MLEINNEQNKVKVNNELKKIITDVINETLKHEGIKKPCEISMVLTDNESIKKLNKEFRNIDRATDVLSFPMLKGKNGNIILNEDDIDPENGEILLGDIVISVERAIEQAEEFGHSVQREIAYLTVHSMLHLLGYDHETDDDKIIMRNREEEILKNLNLLRE